jgi:hypothetical protein
MQRNKIWRDLKHVEKQNMKGFEAYRDKIWRDLKHVER